MAPDNLWPSVRDECASSRVKSGNVEKTKSSGRNLNGQAMSPELHAHRVDCRACLNSINFQRFTCGYPGVGRNDGQTCKTGMHPRLKLWKNVLLRLSIGCLMSWKHLSFTDINSPIEVIIHDFIGDREERNWGSVIDIYGNMKICQEARNRSCLPLPLSI